VENGTRQPGGKPGGIRAAIALLILIPVLVPLFAATLIWLGERDATAATNDKLQASTQVASANVRLLFETTLKRLEGIDQQLGPDPGVFSATRRGLEGLTALYDAKGNTITESGVRGVSIADNAEFIALATGKRWVVSPMLVLGQNIRLFAIARRLERNGEFAGVASVLVPADFLQETWSTLRLGDESTVAIVREDGWIVSRYPLPAEAQNIAGGMLMTHADEAPEDIFSSPASPIDGAARSVSYVRLEDLGVVVSVAMSRTSTLEGFWTRVRSTALVAAPIFLAMVFLCGWAVLLVLRHERRRGELELALQRNKMLLQEIHHRVKNNLQQVASLVRLQQAPTAMKENLTGRITAMSAVHQYIYESDQYGVLDAEAYLARLLGGLRDSAPPGVVLEWSLAPLQLTPDQALPLGMIVNEVISNAFKHGFPNGKTGKVEIALTRPLEGNEAVLTIADNGVGMGETPAGGVGLGTRLINGLGGQLQGKTSVERSAEGVRFELRFPVTEASEGAAAG
jgi:two-component sensor histidine kinase